MLNILLYWGTAFVGYIIGYKTKEKYINMNLLDKIPFAIIGILVFTMGMRMGSNKEIISKIGSIGLIALVFTVIVILGGVIAVSILRRLIGLDKYGYFHNKNVINSEVTVEVEKIEKYEEESQNHNHSTSILIVVSVLIGLAVGYFYIRNAVTDPDKFYDVTSLIMTVVLVILLGVIGFTLGRTGVVAKNLKHIGIKVILVPIAVIIGTTIAALLCALILKISAKESLAIAYGFGWYSFAPIAIANAGYHFAGAISFLHNVFREMFGLILIPILANKIGYVEITAMPGVAAMDVGMPIIEKATRPDIIVYSFLIGLTEGLIVPIIVPMALNIINF